MALTNNLRVQVKLKISPDTGFFNIMSDDGDALSQASTTVFFTTATPMYATVDYVLMCAGELMESLPDVAVWQMIYSASTWIDDQLLFDVDTKFPDQSTTNQSWMFFQRARTEFVKCKAIRDTMRTVLANRGLSAGRRTLADFTIDLSGQANLISQARSFANEMSSECKYWLDALYSGGAADFQFPSLKTAVKSGTNTSEPGGIGRGWVVGGPSMNKREQSQISNGSKTRPRRYSGRGNF